MGLQFRSLEHKPRIGLQHPDDWPRRAAQFPTLFSEYGKSWIECVAFKFFVSFIDSKLADRHHVLPFSSYYPVFPFCHRRHNQIKTTLDSDDKFAFCRFLGTYDFEGSRKVPKYDYPVVARSAASVYVQRNSFMDIRTSLNRRLIKTLQFLRKITIYVFLRWMLWVSVK